MEEPFDQESKSKESNHQELDIKDQGKNKYPLTRWEIIVFCINFAISMLYLKTCFPLVFFVGVVSNTFMLLITLFYLLFPPRLSLVRILFVLMNLAMYIMLSQTTLASCQQGDEAFSLVFGSVI